MTKTEQAAPALSAQDPIEAICLALFSKENNAAKKGAREQVAGMTHRPWEQLPPRLKSAIRADIRRMLDANASRDDILKSGYSVAIIDRAARDLGRRAV
ncbi:MAG: hypothetical protein QHC90_25895 [Shinella sp.]|nr:hypothetical protein [Shinella sp.]